MSKRCTKCKITYDSGRNFFHDSQKSDGLTSHCKNCIRANRLHDYEKKREKALLYSRAHYSRKRLVTIERQQKKRKEIITKIFSLLGDKCIKCNFENKIALQIDHLNGGGYRHRKIAGGGMNYYKQILNNITSFQLLCANCNFIEGVNKKFRKSIWS